MSYSVVKETSGRFPGSELLTDEERDVIVPMNYRQATLAPGAPPKNFIYNNPVNKYQHFVNAFTYDLLLKDESISKEFAQLKANSAWKDWKASPLLDEQISKWLGGKPVIRSLGGLYINVSITSTLSELPVASHTSSFSDE